MCNMYIDLGDFIILWSSKSFVERMFSAARFDCGSFVSLKTVAKRPRALAGPGKTPVELGRGRRRSRVCVNLIALL